MFKDPYWITAKDLWLYKRWLIIALTCAVLYGVCFGAGLAVVVPLINLFFPTTSNTAQSQQVNTQAVEQTVEALQHQGVIEAAQADQINEYIQANGIGGVQFDNPLRQNVYDKLVVFKQDDQGNGFIPAQTIQDIVNIVPEDPWWTLVGVLSVFGVVSLLSVSCRYLHQYLTITITNHLALRYRGMIFARMLDAPLSLYQTQDVSDTASRVIIDTNALANGHQAILGKAVLDILKGLIALLIAFYMSWQLSILFLVAATLIMFTLKKIGKIIRRASKRALHQQGTLFKQLTAAIAAIPVIKSHNAQGFERRKFKQVSRTLYNEQMTMRRAKALTSPITEFLGYLGMSAAAIMAAYWVYRQGTQPAIVAGVLLSLGMAANSFKPLSSLHNQIKESTAAANRILDAIHAEPEPIASQARQQHPTLPAHHQSVVFENICFAYPSQQDEPALRSIDLSVEHGQTVAIVGSNGSGKTTLLSMLPRLLTPTSGRVLIDGVDIQTVNLHALREQIGVVSQQAVTFEATIAQNIAYAKPLIPLEQIKQAAQAAHADSFIEKLPQGYQHKLGEGGQGLSGGQRQRLCIARALLKNPAIMILDEATSQVDAESEAQIADAMKQARTGRTTFIIAHRLSTVIDADQIVVMDQGQILDTGTHAELLTRCDLYQSLTKHQLVG